MGDLYEIFLNGEYIGDVIACSDDEAQERAADQYGKPAEYDYVVKLVKPKEFYQPRSGRRGVAW